MSIKRKLPGAPKGAAACEGNSAPWERLHLAQVQALRSHHMNLVVLELAQMGTPALVGEERKAMIRELGNQARKDVLLAQLVACKMLLDYLCPSWEAEDLELARMIASRIPPDLAWADTPIRKHSCH